MQFLSQDIGKTERNSLVVMVVVFAGLVVCAAVYVMEGSELDGIEKKSQSDERSYGGDLGGPSGGGTLSWWL
jgi:hypothetical protein